MRIARTGSVFLVVLVMLSFVLMTALPAEAQARYDREAQREQRTKNAPSYAIFILLTLAAVYLVFRGSKRV